jgi:hypothetical protein
MAFEWCGKWASESNQQNISLSVLFCFKKFHEKIRSYFGSYLLYPIEHGLKSKNFIFRNFLKNTLLGVILCGGNAVKIRPWINKSCVLTRKFKFFCQFLSKTMKKEFCFKFSRQYTILLIQRISFFFHCYS